MNLEGTNKADVIPHNMKRYHVAFKIKRNNSYHVFVNADSEELAIKLATNIVKKKFKNCLSKLDYVSEVEKREVSLRKPVKDYESKWEC